MVLGLGYKFDSIVVFEKWAMTSGRGYKILGWIDGVDVYSIDVLFEGEKGDETELRYHQWLGVLLFNHLSVTTAAYWDDAKNSMSGSVL